MSHDESPLRGKLLLSVPALMDPNFRHTVVLLAEHAGHGAVGVILNRPSDITVAWGAAPLADLVEPDAPLHEGGPVSPNTAVLLVEVADPALLDLPVRGSIGIVTGEIDDDLRRHILRARVFAGHAGWGPTQLEAELTEGSWILEDPTPDDIFSPNPDTLWQDILRRKGPPWDRMARVPFDLRSN